MGTDTIDLFGFEESGSGGSNQTAKTSYDSKQDKPDPTAERMANAAERQAAAAEKGAGVTVNLNLDPSKIASPADVPKMPDRDWAGQVDRKVHHGTVSQGGTFMPVKDYYWQTKGERARREYEDARAQEDVDSSIYDSGKDFSAPDRKRGRSRSAPEVEPLSESHRRTIEESVANVSEDRNRSNLEFAEYMDRLGTEQEKESNRKSMVNDTWQIDDSERRHRRRVERFESQFSGLEAEAGGRMTGGSNAPPPATDQGGTTGGQSAGGAGLGALGGLLQGAGLGGLLKMGGVAAAGYAAYRAADFALRPEVGGWYQGAVGAMRTETEEGAKQEATQARISEQAEEFARKQRSGGNGGQTWKGFFRDDVLGIGSSRAQWERGMLYTGAEREEMEKNGGQETDAIRRSKMDARNNYNMRDTYRDREEDKRRNSAYTRPIDPEAGRNDSPEMKDENMFMLPEEVGQFGAMAMVPGTLRAAGQDPYMPGQMNARYFGYHRKQNAAHGKDHMSREDRSETTARSEDYDKAGMQAPMAYRRDTEDDITKWADAATEVFDFLNKTTESERNVSLNYYHYPIQP